EQQRPIRITLHQLRGHLMILLPQGISQVARGAPPFRGLGHHLAPDRTARIAGVDEGEVVGGDRDGEPGPLRRARAFQLLGSQLEGSREVVGGASGVLELPAPVVPALRRGEARRWGSQLGSLLVLRERERRHGVVGASGAGGASGVALVAPGRRARTAASSIFTSKRSRSCASSWASRSRSRARSSSSRT